MDNNQSFLILIGAAYAITAAALWGIWNHFRVKRIEDKLDRWIQNTQEDRQEFRAFQAEALRADFTRNLATLRPNNLIDYPSVLNRLSRLEARFPDSTQ